MPINTKIMTFIKHKKYKKRKTHIVLDGEVNTVCQVFNSDTCNIDDYIESEPENICKMCEQILEQQQLHIESRLFT